MEQTRGRYMRSKLTKIICTLGPSCCKAEIIEEMVKNGMDIARINMSHSDADHQNISRIFHEVEKARKNLDFSLALDTKGREIRIIEMEGDPIFVYNNDMVVFYKPSTDLKLEDINTKKFADELSEGGRIHFIGLDYDLYQHVGEFDQDTIFKIDDGYLELKFIKFSQKLCIARSLDAHKFENGKSVRVPGLKLKIPIDNEKDKADILFGLRHNVDMIFLSHVETASDVVRIRDFVSESTKNTPLIVSKIESQRGFNNLKEIIAVSDGIMVARGDLSTDFRMCEIHLLQKHITEQCRLFQRPCIIATQMLESMVRNNVPTRAEVTDVTTAVLDWNDCVMLSAETASGRYPIQCVKVLAQICQSTEHSPLFDCFENDRETVPGCSSIYDVFKAGGFTDHGHDFFLPKVTKEDLLHIQARKHRILLLGLTNDPEVLKLSKLYRGAYLVYNNDPNLDSKQSMTVFNQQAPRHPNLVYENLIYMVNERQCTDNPETPKTDEQSQSN